ncbi:cellular nucleic acid-binding protein, partial [Trifolium medium]|nr:cellular nucleic acid-binding protein [Trifolium medium]
KANYYKAANDKRGRDFAKGKLYGRGGGRKPDEGGSSGGKVVGDRNCFKCGQPGHRFFECPKNDGRCLKC